MLKMMNPIGLAMVLIFLSGLSSVFTAESDALIRVEHLRWDCAENGTERYCTISFELVNTTTARQIRKVHIRAISSSGKQPDESNQPCGQMHFSILLEAGESVAFQELMPVAAMPDNITVSVWE